MKAVLLLIALIGAAVAYPMYQEYDEEESCSNNYRSFRGMCSYEPCSRSSCSMSGYTCRNNYCGGCHARWYDNNGNYYHQCSSYSWRMGYGHNFFNNY